MAKSVDSTLLALLATLEERARKNGEKSIVKSVIGRLADEGADDHLIAEIAALRPKKAGASKSAAETKAPRKSNGKTGVDVTKAAKPETPVTAS
jgi:hypothetical protein